MFPLIAKDGGVLQRAGHTEASIDLCKLANLSSAALIVEIVDEDGTMARGEKLVEISEKYNSALISYEKENPSQSVLEMKSIINSKDSTYSPLALYFLLDNNLLKSKNEINEYFNIIINEINLDTEIKNLIIYKKGLYNSNSATEEELLNILNPLINSESIWKSHSLYLMAEYFFSKNEKQKSKEFFEKILEMEDSNPQIKIQAQKRLRRDLGA